jgi:hypothetical protein
MGFCRLLFSLSGDQILDFLLRIQDEIQPSPKQILRDARSHFALENA